jgi:hypothetical protein
VKKIIHIHIPKSAGSTFNKCLSYYFGKRVVRVKGHFNYSYPIPAEMANASIVTGHLDLQAILDLGKTTLSDSIIFCFVRNPVDRVISGYYNILRDPTNPAYNVVKDFTLKEYVMSEIVPDVDNGQVRRLSFAGARNNETKTISTDHLKQAMSFIQQYSMNVGISESFDVSLLSIVKDLDWRMPRYLTVNRGKNKPKINDRKSMNEIYSLIIERNQFDAALYQFVQKRQSLMPRVSSTQLSLFRWLNRCYYIQNASLMINNKFNKRKN